MAVGDVVSADATSVANNAYLDTAPGAGVEAVITNIFYAGAVEVYFYDGTNEILVLSDSASGSILNCSFHVTSTRRIRIKNVSGGTVRISYDGVQTK